MSLKAGVCSTLRKFENLLENKHMKDTYTSQTSTPDADICGDLRTKCGQEDGWVRYPNGNFGLIMNGKRWANVKRSNNPDVEWFAEHYPFMGHYIHTNDLREAFDFAGCRWPEFLPNPDWLGLPKLRGKPWMADKIAGPDTTPPAPAAVDECAFTWKCHGCGTVQGIHRDGCRECGMSIYKSQAEESQPAPTPITNDPPLMTITVNRAKWRQLASLVTPAHEHQEGMNECHICDRPVVDAAIERIADLERQLAEAREQRDRLAHVIEVILEHAEGYQDSGIDLETGLHLAEAWKALAAVKENEPNAGGMARELAAQKPKSTTDLNG